MAATSTNGNFSDLILWSNQKEVLLCFKWNHDDIYRDRFVGNISILHILWIVLLDCKSTFLQSSYPCIRSHSHCHHYHHDVHFLWECNDEDMHRLYHRIPPALYTTTAASRQAKTAKYLLSWKYCFCDFNVIWLISMMIVTWHMNMNEVREEE